MGAAVGAEIGGICLPLVVGGAVGSSCSLAHDRCSQRICVVEGRKVSTLCVEVASCSPELTFMVNGEVHSASVVQGVVGVFQDNEPVVGIRARALPYVQAIGKPAPEEQRLWAARQLFTSATASAGGSAGGGPGASGFAGSVPDAVGQGPAVCRFSFDNLSFALPGLSMHDQVIISFGTRTVLRLPFWTNAPLDFDVLGTMQVPLWQLLQSQQPVEVLVPIQPRGETLTHVARVSLTLQVPQQPGPSRVARVEPDAVPVLPGGEDGISAFRCDSDDVEKEIQALENQLKLLKSLPLYRQDKG